MVHQKNIVRNDKEISADYYPEDCDEKGFICVNIRSGKSSGTKAPHTISLWEPTLNMQR